MLKRSSIFIIFFFLLFPAAVLGRSFVLFVDSGMSISDPNAFAGDTVKIYAVVVNNNFESLSANVKFYNGNEQIGTAEVRNLSFEQAKQVSVSYELPFGEQVLEMRLSDVVAKDKDGNIKTISDDEIANYVLRLFVNVEHKIEEVDVPAKEEVKEIVNPVKDKAESEVVNKTPETQKTTNLLNKDINTDSVNKPSNNLLPEISESEDSILKEVVLLDEKQTEKETATDLIVTNTKEQVETQNTIKTNNNKKEKKAGLSSKLLSLNKFNLDFIPNFDTKRIVQFSALGSFIIFLIFSGLSYFKR